ncbi:prepilin peptidase [archaeon]|nr:prepilin peptidase [archaeon]MBT4373848.1 prepilin peptidase [archaeon]MBT4532370.1 prepilin peptidase [archaeon]MBT7001751.1 prepilin peptidase [archaeon]MBT7281924.1 prepilin peptidase [archaeon]
MIEVVFLICLALIWILFAVLQDLKTKEVSNWLNFSLIVFALGFRFFWSLFSESANGFAFFYQGLIGFGIFLVLGNLFYYGRLFGGGDAKLMIALGAILPFSEEFLINVKIFGLFLILFLFVGAGYGLCWSLVLAIKNYKSFRKEFYKLWHRKKVFTLLFIFIGILLMCFYFIDSLFLVLGIFIFIMPYFYLFAKAIENCCMLVEIPVNKLREGDWLAENVKIKKGEVVKQDWEGISNKEISLIQKKFKKVKIKQGIVYVPVFLISFLILIYLWFTKFYFLF